MKFRQVEKIIRSPHAHWVGNGFRVKQYFPAKRDYFLERFSPFILLDYNEPYFFPASPFETGIGPHPHRGFETVTFALAGKIEHGDNQGNHGVIEPGDLQWMTAGRGILHKEFHETEFAKRDRVLHMIQLWVNLPAEFKWTEPIYQAITADQMGRYQSMDLQFEVIVYAGEAFGIEGPARTFSPMNIYKLDIKQGETVLLEEPADFNTGILIISGKLQVNEEYEVMGTDFLLFANDGQPFALTGEEAHSEVFVLSGQPLHEPVFKMGPFVMNTKEEAFQAHRDFQDGLFGDMNF